MSGRDESVHSRLTAVEKAMLECRTQNLSERLAVSASRSAAFGDETSKRTRGDHEFPECAKRTDLTCCRSAGADCVDG